MGAIRPKKCEGRELTKDQLERSAGRPTHPERRATVRRERDRRFRLAERGWPGRRGWQQAGRGQGLEEAQHLVPTPPNISLDPVTFPVHRQIIWRSRYYHNLLWQGDPVYKFDSSVNDSMLFETQGYTTLIQTAPHEALVFCKIVILS